MATSSDLVQFASELWTLYRENYDYLSTASVDKATKFIEAINGLIGLPEEVRNAAGESMRTNTQTLFQLRSEVQKWVSAKRASKNQYTFLRQCGE